MNWKKGKKIVAVFLLLALAVEMAGYHFISEKEQLIVNDTLADSREATVEGMKNPLDTVEYLMNAVQQKMQINLFVDVQLQSRLMERIMRIF